MIKAIETVYKGYHFRSRLEARWAVFFDALGLEWEYEPEGYEFKDGTRYLPDFYLRELRLWVEVKPDEPSLEELGKLTQLVEATNDPAFMTRGLPDKTGYGCYIKDDGSTHVGVAYLMMGKEDDNYPRFMDFLFSQPDQPETAHNLRYGDGNILIGHTDAKTPHFWWLNRRSIDAAKSAKFEFGQSGATL